MVVAAVAIGSNLGDRAAHIAFALERLARILRDLRCSASIETEPEGMPGSQGRVLNAAAVGMAEGSSRDLLTALLGIERERGRERPFPGAPRTLDLDLILFGGQSVNEEGLAVPHPRFRERGFVLAPLAEIAPTLRDPVTGLTVGQLLRDLGRARPGAGAPHRP